MTRVATYGNYQSALLNLMNTQLRNVEAQERVSTEKNATDLTGFGRQSEALTAMKGAQSRIQGFIDTAEAVEARLVTQDLAMNQINDSIIGIRAALGNVLSTDSSGSLMLELEGQFQTIRAGLNMRHQGGYLFAGASIATTPVDIANLSELVAAPTLASVFHNDTLKTASRVAEGTALETGFLANELGTDVLGILRDIQNFHITPASGPLTGKLTEVQKTFLIAQLSRLDQASAAVIEKTAVTGSLASQVETLAAGQQAQKLALDGLVAGRTDADMAKAVTDLELSEIAIQASAQVISQLRQASLLNYLS